MNNYRERDKWNRVQRQKASKKLKGERATGTRDTEGDERETGEREGTGRNRRCRKEGENETERETKLEKLRETGEKKPKEGEEFETI